ncbi:unnamed protein product [Caenorhabditis bovis]|uniref:DUF7596 domain-containing protein n=1 Tax=Caenorhabditis bovis TaxID=2654633 RepID=A0A8S1EX43_9PELO|nr:unnamed protein product [Caenorhabditis bovis]
MTPLLEISKLALPVEKLPESSVAVLNDDSGRVLARETIVKFGNSQAYLVLQDLHSSIANKDLLVKNEDLLHLKLVKIETQKENRRLLPLAQQFHSLPDARPAHCHLSDLLAEHSLGRFNLELKKNVTIDSFLLDDSWRDDAGFIVTDRNVFYHYTFNTASLLKSLIPSSEKIVAYTKADFEAVADFDNSVCGFSRDAFLEVLLANKNVLIAKSTDSVNGMIAGSGEQVNLIYAETIEIAHALLKAYIQKNNLKNVKLFAPTGVWEAKPLEARQVYRRHTRAVPSSLKWPKIYALNMGSHIV